MHITSYLNLLFMFFFCVYINTHKRSHFYAEKGKLVAAAHGTKESDIIRMRVVPLNEMIDILS